ncbi:hypothetical protein HDU96_000670 [Phlyctochytrium bullatum]|nr:hypothetical protein HDU96_000670 [Phlyctochytrium bullatum]
MLGPALLTLLYFLTTIASAALIAVSLVPLPKHLPQLHRRSVMVIGTLVTEFPFLFFGFKLLLLFWFSSSGIFASIPSTPVLSQANTTATTGKEPTQEPATQRLWSDWVYYLDVLCFLGYWALALQLYFAKNVVDNATAVFKNAESTEAPGIFTAGFWFRIMNPFWKPRHVKVHRDICYATQEELNFAGPGMEGFLSLDIYHHASFPRNRPVLIYLHAGSYTSGSKSFPVPPFVLHLAASRWVVVCVNTRLAPAHPYPAHLIDAKRALRWVRSNISRFGGDPGFVAVAGTASGAHVAAMMALTAGDPVYQPGFEEVDTAVQACVCVGAVLDVVDSRRMWPRGWARWFARSVAAKDESKEEDAEFLRLSSPVVLVKGLEAERRRSAASVVGERLRAESISEKARKAGGDGRLPVGLKSGDAIPPFIVFHGATDSLIPVRHVRDFVSTFKKVSKSTITYVEFPAANHMFNIVGCRSHYMAYGIQRFLRYMHERYQAGVLFHAKTE